MAVDRLPKRSELTQEEVEMPAAGLNPEQSAIADDWQRKVHRLIDGLPEEMRQPLALSTIESMTSGEIAIVVGIPEGTVRTRVLRARQLLREKLAVMEGRDYAAKRS
jgi:RNA polymerase sigma-70 factor (ECF subfamily)